ncbi:GPR1/FUN34/yaaH [Penicillium fimorum]|uniref:GPR1/FUN34/yaaH n=1 Tax=Penicillium fimorum TaxID=1882269 RepID=A0A9X0C657_9EURO|nr:GPR1/FUN34/yaaH [Penicillium fimorum]
MSHEDGISVKDTNTSSPDSDDYETGHFGPLAHVNTASSRYPAFGGDLQPGLYRVPKDRKLANPAPLGLCAFALTTFVLGCLNMNVKGIAAPNIIVGPALAYGGLVQLLAGMWEMAIGNTFGATVLSSYGGFWISLAITFIPGGFDIIGALEEADHGSHAMFYNSFALYLFGWFIFTTLVTMLTLKSTVAFFSLFFFVDLALLLLALGYYFNVDGVPNEELIKAGGLFALLGAFLAWYNAFAGIADSSNSFFLPPVVHFPWSEKKRSARRNSAGQSEEV